MSCATVSARPFVDTTPVLLTAYHVVVPVLTVGVLEGLAPLELVVYPAIPDAPLVESAKTNPVVFVPEM